MRDYWWASLDLLSEILNVYDSAWPVYTQAQAHRPTRISATAKVTHSLICEGCVIDGTVEYSVLSPGVYVAPGAVVRNAVVMHNTHIEESAWVEDAIVDMDVVVGSGARVESANCHALAQSALERDPIAVVQQGTHVLAEEATRGAALSRVFFLDAQWQEVRIEPSWYWN